MKLFLTPNATLTTGIRWSDALDKFLPCAPQASDYVFEIATPTRAELHEHYGAFMGIPARGSVLDYSELEQLIWGTDNKPGLVRKVLPDFKLKGCVPHPTLTLSIARIVREQLGMETPLVETPAETTPAPGIDSEGNSGSPSESGSAS